MDCISVRFLAVILYHIYARYYHWKKLGKKIYDLSFFLKAIKPFFFKKMSMREVIGESTEGRGEVTCPSSHMKQLDSRASGSYPLLCAASPSDRKLLYPLLLGASCSSLYLTLVM